jgi:microcystin-dependent protein
MDSFLSEIRIFPYQYAPKGWAFCDGQSLSIPQNTALFSLLGTTFGGDGQQHFNLPDLQGSAPMHPQQGPDLTYRRLGDSGGEETVTLIQSEIPIHTHTWRVSGADAVTGSPVAQQFGSGVGIGMYTTSSSSLTPMSGYAVTPTGGGLPHNNMQPYLTLSFCISLDGEYPGRP